MEEVRAQREGEAEVVDGGNGYGSHKKDRRNKTRTHISRGKTCTCHLTRHTSHVT
jgi:hypothetical protein